MLINNEKQFANEVKKISNMGEKLAESIHEAGLFALQQVNTHGNDGFAVRLIEALGKKHDKVRVMKWLCTFGKLGTKDGILVYRKRKDIDAENLDAWLEKANSIPYWELTPQAEFHFKVDYLSILKGALAKHKKAVALADEGKQVEEGNVGLIAEIEAIVVKYTPKVEPVITADHATV